MKKYLTKNWKKLLGLLMGIPILLFALAIAVVYMQQEKLVQFYLQEFNDDIHGHVVIRKSTVAPFQNFPYISIDLQGVQVFENEDAKGKAILEIEDVYLGFDLIKLLGGKTEVKTIKLKKGHLDIVQDMNSELNIARAFESKKPVEEISEAMQLKLKSIVLEDLDISKFNEQNQMLVDAFINEGELKLGLNEERQKLHADLDLILTVMQNGDSTFFKKKHSTIHTDFVLDNESQLLTFARSQLTIEKASFNFEGSYELKDDLNMDFKLNGDKPNFDLFLSFAPPELAPTLERYKNAGDVYFDAWIKGPSLNQQPHIEAKFGCKETYVSNEFNKKKVDQLQFNAYFTNGDSNNFETMRFELRDFEARPEAGKFKGFLSVKNFEEPDINLQLDSDFNLDFLMKFFNVDDIYKLNGQVLLQMNFHDIIDLDQPEKSLEKFEQAYYANLKIKDLSFESPDFHLPVKKIDVAAETSGNDVLIKTIDAKIGKSDLHIEGKIKNFIDLVHHTEEEVEIEFSAISSMLDLKDMTQSKRNPEQFIDDKIKSFKTHFKFVGSAKNLTEFEHLPKGHFIIDELYAEFQNYPHKLHDFDIDLEIVDEKILCRKFHGEIDKSDIDLYCTLSNYATFMGHSVDGDATFDFGIQSKHLILKDLLTYNGVNYLSEDYRKEELKDFKIKAKAFFHFKENELNSGDVDIYSLQGKMDIHPLKLEQFKGRIHWEDEHLQVQDFSGKMGHSTFKTSLNYYYGNNPEIKKRDNFLKIDAARLDLDELMNYNPPKKNVKIDHDAGFNLYALPFPDMRFEANIGLLNYHQYKIKNIKAKLHTTQKHELFFDVMDLDVADGHIKGKGRFDGADPKKIMLYPDIAFEKMDMKKLMIKFDNFGQDELISDNLTGILNGKLTGKIRMHVDMTPMIQESSLDLDLTVLKGVINDYAPFLALKDYFKDKNLSKIAFDTLQNNFSLKNGVMNIPRMTINSSLGFLQIEGTQDMDYNMNYLIRVPFSMVTQAASQKLFKRKREEIDPEKEDEIIYFDPARKTRFIQIRMEGNIENYKVSIERKKI